MWSDDLKGKITPEKRDKAELDRVIKALEGTGSNPIIWANVIRLVAPIIARIATRYALRLIARKVGKRISAKAKEETVLSTSDYIATIAVKRTTAKKK